MSEHTPLDPSQLSTAAQRALGPGPGRMMAARGMMPLPPADQVAVLYQLSIDAETSLAQSARMTASQLPERLVAGTLADPTLDPRVLDFFAQLGAEKAMVFDAIVMNPSVADTTLAMLASRGGAREVDLIAQNEKRLLRHPEIIGAMYMNRHARMSTIDRIVELAVRNNVRVPGVAAWDEVARALTGEPPPPELDQLFESVAEKLSGDDSALTSGNADDVAADDAAAPAAEPDTKDLPWSELPLSAKIRAAQVGNAEARGLAVRSPIKILALAGIKAAGMTDNEAARFAGNATLCEEVIRYIASNKAFTKQYGVKVALCRNPKTPIAESSRMIMSLRERELVLLTKSKGVPSALVAQARKLQMQRKGNTGK